MYDRNIFTKGYEMYVIRNENNEVMRSVGRQEEAIAVCSLREGWTFKCVRKPKLDLSQFEEALI